MNLDIFWESPINIKERYVTLKQSYKFPHVSLVVLHSKQSKAYTTVSLDQIEVAFTSGLKCLYSLVNYFLRNFEHMFMKLPINLFQK